MKVRFLYIAYVAVLVVVCGAVGGFAGLARDDTDVGGPAFLCTARRAPPL